MKAAVGSVLNVARAFELVRVDEAMVGAEFLRDARRVQLFAFG